MKVIVVSGASSHPGKTSVAVMLLKTLPGWAAIKVTPSCPDRICPHGRECSACDLPEAPYELVTDEEIIETPGKDTARLKEAGASQVIWARAPFEILPVALAKAFEMLSTAPGVLVETTTALPLLNGTNIMVATGEEIELKDSAKACTGLVDVLVVNVRGSVSGTSSRNTILPEDSPLRALEPRRIISACALLPTDHPANRELTQVCSDIME